MNEHAVLIFDLDGTLFHTETVIVPAVREAFALHGLAPPPDHEICSLIGRTSAEYEPWLHGLCSPDVADRIVSTAVERELELIPTAGALYPGVPAALTELREYTGAMAVCSNGSRRYVEAVLSAHGIDWFFDAIRCRRPDDRHKPQMVGDLLEALGARGPARGVLVGDRNDDVEAARANGLRAVGCAYGYGGDGELEGADAIAASPAEMAKLVRRVLIESSR